MLFTASDYYTQGKLLSYALFDLLTDGLDIGDEIITFKNGNEYTLKEIYEKLLLSLDIGYRSFMGELTDDDTNHALYDISMELYANPVLLPSNSGLYGIKLSKGSSVGISNVKIQDLQLNTLEIPGADFTNCLDDADSEILKDPFGKVVDLRNMVGDIENAVAIELGDIVSGRPGDIVHINTGFIYEGNPISDAYIALSLYRGEYGQTQGANKAFYGWVLDNYEDGVSYDGLPSCVSFTCNNNINDNQNEGIIGIDLNEISDVKLENVVIKRLFNKSPLSAYVCGNYTADTKGSDTKGMILYLIFVFFRRVSMLSINLQQFLNCNSLLFQGLL